MTRTATIAGVAGLLLGLLFGYVWWARAPAPPGASNEGRGQLEQALDEARARGRKAREDLKVLQSRLQSPEADLARERQQRSGVEAIVREGAEMTAGGPSRWTSRSPSSRS